MGIIKSSIEKAVKTKIKRAGVSLAIDVLNVSIKALDKANEVLDKKQFEVKKRNCKDRNRYFMKSQRCKGEGNQDGII